jgi:hypothetical protein
MLLRIITTRKFWTKYLFIFVSLFLLIFLIHNHNILSDGIALRLPIALIFKTFFDFRYTFDIFGLVIFFLTLILASYVFALSINKNYFTNLLGSLFAIFGTFCFACGFFIVNILAAFGIFLTNLDRVFGVIGLIILTISAVIISHKINRGLC